MLAKKVSEGEKEVMYSSTDPQNFNYFRIIYSSGRYNFTFYLIFYDLCIKQGLFLIKKLEKEKNEVKLQK